MPRKTTDAVLIGLLDQLERERATCEKWYAAMKRAIGCMDRARTRYRRLAKRIDEYERQTNQSAA